MWKVKMLIRISQRPEKTQFDFFVWPTDVECIVISQRKQQILAYNKLEQDCSAFLIY